MSYALDFPSGKKWVADQLDSVASRYLNRNARVVAEMVRESMQSDPPSLKFITAMRPEPPLAGNQGKAVAPEQESWAHSLNEPDLYQTFLNDDKRPPSMVGMRDSSGAKVEEIYPSETPVAWGGRLH
jgi:hypothetical protein